MVVARRNAGGFFFSLPIPLSVLHDAHQPTGTTETGCVVYLGNREDGWV